MAKLCHKKALQRRVGAKYANTCFLRFGPFSIFCCVVAFFAFFSEGAFFPCMLRFFCCICFLLLAFSGLFLAKILAFYVLKRKVLTGAGEKI